MAEDTQETIALKGITDQNADHPTGASSAFKYVRQIRPDDPEETRRFVIEFDGTVFSSSFVYEFKSKSGETLHSYIVHDLPLIERILQLTISDFNNFSNVTIFRPEPLHNFRYSLSVSWHRVETFNEEDEIISSEKTGELRLELDAYPRPGEWLEHFSFLEFSTAVERVNRRRENGFELSLYSTDYEENLEIYKLIRAGDISLAEIFDPFEAETKLTFDDALLEMERSSSKGEILASFEFPDDLQVPCEQYLLYFSQFLKDIGISAESSLTREAGHVLFAVNPADGNDALQRIKEALAVYLNLPEANVVFDESFASMRLQQQVENLKHSQSIAGRELKLAQRVIEAQDRVIEEKNQTINQQQRILDIINPAIMMNSAKNKDELEEIYEGVRVGESEALKKWLGIGLNPAKALGAMGKSMLGRDPLCPSIIEVECNSED